VALCRSAANLLTSRYSISDADIEVIRHGAHWSPQPINHQPRRNLITWGLLGPGKGLEQSIEAVASLRDIDPPLRYRIVGRTHPAIVEREGFSYRRRLESLVRERDLSDVVEFVDRYVDEDELFEMVRQSDVVVVPYLNTDQVSSGVITEALACGRPVVATRFPYSEEILASGAGIVTEHDMRSIGSGIRALIEDPTLYVSASRDAAEQSERLSWKVVAGEYAQLIRSLTPARATA
jgi:glycosyltransferase involved in cell wall biosynthesis